MRLIGMMDSPYVRRVAISLKLMGIEFTHEPVSVFRQFGSFAAINPVVKAPTLVTGDGIVMMDSTLILEYAGRLAPPERQLAPQSTAQFGHAQRIVGLALAACEKTVQIVYERNLRPAEKQHQPWIDRLTGQLLAAYRLLEAGIASRDGWLLDDRPLQADVSLVVAWSFTQSVLGDAVVTSNHPALHAFADRAEALPEFKSTPIG
ncbi:MAG: glutathione S-transferase [Rhodomicrobium sp.]|nr:glutathione S-transferase [Rhodomicrobium sp.]